MRRSWLSRPEQRRRERPGAGGQGAALEVPGSQPLANSEFLRQEHGLASVSAPAHPPFPDWAPLSRVGGTARSAQTPGPLPTLGGWVMSLLHPPTHHHSLVRNGLSGGSWLGGTAPLPHPPGLVWCCPLASSCSCPPGAGRGMGREGKARRAWTGQSAPPPPSSGRKGQREAFSSWNVGDNLSRSTWAIGVPSPTLSFLSHKMGRKSSLPAGEINERRS